MKFNNRHNECITHADRELWISRACTVVATVICYVDNLPYVLLGKRGIGCPDEVGKWNLPCGYLDWDETLAEAMVREIYEETGLNISKAQSEALSISTSHMEQPWKVSSNISGRANSKQNVSNHFALVYAAKQLATLSMDYCEPDEVEEVRWVPLEEIHQYDYAFNHIDVINEFLLKAKI